MSSGFAAGAVLAAADLNAALVWKRVRVATTANGTLATAFANGQTVDGITLATGDRILLKNQSSGAENGIYDVAASGAPTRALDFDSASECLPNTVVIVSVGTTNADTAWQITNDGTITPGSTAQVWAAFPAGTLPAVVGCRAIKSASQSINNASATAIQWDGTNSWGATTYHDPSSNNTRLIAATFTGKWRLFLNFNLNSGTSEGSTTEVQIRKNGTTIIAAYNIRGWNSTWAGFHIADEFSLTAADYLEVLLYQNSGASINVTDGSGANGAAGSGAVLEYAGS